MGETDIDEPVTAPIPDMEKVGAGLPETDQERVEELPVTILAGLAEKEEMTGAESGAGAPVSLYMSEISEEDNARLYIRTSSMRPWKYSL